MSFVLEYPLHGMGINPKVLSEIFNPPCVTIMTIMTIMTLERRFKYSAQHDRSHDRECVNDSGCFRMN